MDPTNLRILDLLQQDGRMPVADIARHLGRAESTVRERLSALESSGVVQGYRVVLEPAHIGQPTRAVVRAGCDLRRLPQVQDRLAAIPQVSRAVVTTGPEPLLIEVMTRDLQALERMLVDRLGALDLSMVRTDVVMSGLVDRPVLLRTLEEERPRPHPGNGLRVAATPAR